jgi:hypothetical protein
MPWWRPGSHGYTSSIEEAVLRDNQDENSYCLIRECSPAGSSLPRSNVPQLGGTMERSASFEARYAPSYPPRSL